jgi:hypothetical protein
MLKARSVVNCSLRSSKATPTRIVMVPVRARMGRLSARIRLRFLSPDPESQNRGYEGCGDEREGEPAGEAGDVYKISGHD